MTVIIPVYNVAPYLREALDSVVNQTYRDLEIIIIDDGSTDGSGDICDEYKVDSRVKIIHQLNFGLSAARNTGLDLMTGEYVAFLDSDDKYHPDFINSMVSCLTLKRVNLVVCGYEIISNDKRIQKTVDSGELNRNDALRCLVDGKIDWSVWNKIYDRRLWEGTRFPVGQVYEDINTIYKIVNKCDKVILNDKILYIKRSRIGSITNTCTQKTIDSWVLAYTQYESFVRSNTPDLFTTEQLKLIHNRRISIMIGFYYRYCRAHMGLHSRTQDDIQYLYSLKNQILNECSGCYRFGTRVSFYLLNYCPELFVIIYWLYSHLGLLVMKTEK